MLKSKFTLVPLLLLMLSACAVIKQDQIGVKRRFGQLVEMDGPGTHVFNPFVSTYIILPSRSRKVSLTIDLPSKEGVIIQGQMSFLYKIIPDSAMSILTKSGVAFEETVVKPTFRSTARDVSAMYFAKSMHTTDRIPIETSILKEMNDFLTPRGFIVQSVLLESVKLPAGLSDAIVLKMQAEQEYQQMEFQLQSERKEAQRKAIEAAGERDALVMRSQGTRDAMRTEAEGDRDAARIQAEGRRDALRIEAEGARDAQLLVNGTLSPTILRYLGIEAARALCNSPNTKVIVTDGNNPVQIK